MGECLIINGVLERGTYQDIEKYAFLQGFATCRLAEYLGRDRKGVENAALVFIDRKGIENQPKDVLNILYMQCPIMIVPAACDETAPECLEKDGWGCAPYPFSYKAFQETVKDYAKQSLMKDRVQVYGNMQIDKGRREVRIGGKKLAFKRFEYEIFLILVEHMGEAVSREYINGILPWRVRGSDRNIDAHIKGIRRVLGRDELIQCVRKVGYSIPTDLLYRKMKQQS